MNKWKDNFRKFCEECEELGATVEPSSIAGALPQ